MTLTPDGKAVWVSMEAARFEDGSDPTVDKPGGPARITLYHSNSGNPIRQIATCLTPSRIGRCRLNGEADNGIPEILMLDQFRMLVLGAVIRGAWAIRCAST